MQEVKIIAGPCSVNKNNIEELYKIADLKTGGKRAVYGLRVVGLKSRTNFSSNPENMGMDVESALSNLDKAVEGISPDEWDMLPSIEIAEKVRKDTGLVIASEIVLPHIQLPLYAKKLGEGEFILWNPAPAQLGWHIYEMARYAREYNWQIGLKNPKWSNLLLSQNGENRSEESVLEKTWKGVISYTKSAGADYFLIHRGVDTPDKGDYRSAPVHQLAEKVKLETGSRLFFDPSHSLGPKKRDEIVEETVRAMQMKTQDGYLYDGILIEVGTSYTDTDQHITIDELQVLIDKISEFRDIY